MIPEIESTVAIVAVSSTGALLITGVLAFISGMLWEVWKDLSQRGQSQE